MLRSLVNIVDIRNKYIHDHCGNYSNYPRIKHGHGKSPFLSSVNHLFLWAIYTMAMINKHGHGKSRNDGKSQRTCGGGKLPSSHGFLIPGGFPDVIQKPRNHPHHPTSYQEFGVTVFYSNRKKMKKSRICHCFSQKSYVSISFWGLYHHYTVIFQGAWPHPMLDELPLLSNAQYLHPRDFIINCLVVDLPLWKNMSHLGWWHDPNWMESH